MKKVMNVVEVEGEGLMSLLGETVEVWCMNYFYWGTLAGVNEHDILLENAYVVYETGPLTNTSFKDAQKLPNPRYIRIASIESYAPRKVTM